MSISPVPQLQIRQQYAQIGIDADMGQWDIEQPRATQELTTTPSRLDMHTQPGQLSIDNSKWHDALGFGPSLEAFSRIYSECKNIALQGIAKIVEDGNRMAAIQTGENAFSALAKESTKDIDFYEYMYMGDASLDNIDMSYQPAKVDIQYTPAHVEHHVTVNPPKIHYQRGKLDIYMKQYASVEFIPPSIDTKR
ncbi:hypothetical protein SK3146_03640 [Paenibacillus konkukensis]|uniref:Uncharacterized protein n=1 Tax=Paenibacillus konkukensis TaxID=2020716 RepID=A0ABY4RRP2_9BACL|nr:DUF6470 family protein [Paenibacillus konkukensis]UQZ84394.1 hypothetical protein SK3146_03640 [Paenibacillus konkukensis]